MSSEDNDLTARYQAIMAHCRRFHGADDRRALFVLFLNMVLFLGGLGGMYLSLGVSYALVLVLAVPTAFMLVRLFIVQHDCGHGSYFSSPAANAWTGRAISLLTFAPYTYWRREHDVHHAYVGQIDRQDVGYIDIYTDGRYLSLPAWRRALYRFYRHPIVLLVIGVPLHNILLMRLPPLTSQGYNDRRFLSFAGAWRSIMLHNLCLFTLYGFAAYCIGAGALLGVYLSVLIFAWQIGGWMFYVHHHFEDAYWQPQESWHPHAARLMASSQYDLPHWLHWLTGYIGLHHIHHFSSAVPHYKLFACNAALDDLRQMNRIGFRESLSCIWLAIIDPARRKMVSLRALSEME